jgi:hypothetical protein
MNTAAQCRGAASRDHRACAASNIRPNCFLPGYSSTAANGAYTHGVSEHWCPASATQLHFIA